MKACPEIDVLLSASERAAACDHLSGCEACAAVVALAGVRDEREAGRDDDCTQAEVAIALWQAELLPEDDRAALIAHLERCAACNELAARMRALGPDVLAVGPARTQTLFEPPGLPLPLPRARGRIAALAAAAIVLALGAALAWRGLRRAPVEALALPPTPETVVSRPGAAPAPVVAPMVPAPVDSTAPPPPLPAKRPAPGRHVGDLIDPWSTPPQPSAATSSGGPRLMNPWSQPALGYLDLNCAPACNAVYVDGKNFGPSPVVRAAVASGTHAVRFVRGSVRKSRTVVVQAGKTASVSQRMDDPADMQL
jgi:Putative zinc-finger